MIELITSLLIIAALVIATEAITELLVDSEIMAPFRNWIFKKGYGYSTDTNNELVAMLDDKEPPKTSKFWIFWCRVLKCGYCASVWVSMVAAIFSPWIFSWWVINWIIMFVVIHRLSNCFHIILMIIKKGRVKTIDIELTHKTKPTAVDNGSDGQVGSSESFAFGPERSTEAS